MLYEIVSIIAEGRGLGIFLAWMISIGIYVVFSEIANWIKGLGLFVLLRDYFTCTVEVVRDMVTRMYLPWREVQEGTVFPTKEGFFMHRTNGEVAYYYRYPEDLGSKVVRLEEDGGSGVGIFFEPRWKIYKPPASVGESALPGAKLKECDDQTLWKGTFKVFSDSGVYNSMGLNLAGVAVLCAHSVKGKGSVVLCGSNSTTSGVKIAESRFKIPEHYYEGSGTDFAVALLTGNEWAAIGAKALSCKDFASPTIGAVDMRFGQGVEGVLFDSSGRLPAQAPAALKAGILMHKVSTEPGASGGVIRRYVGGVPKYVGFHVARPDVRMRSCVGSYNVAIDFDMIFSYLRYEGLYYDSVYSIVKKAALGEAFDYDHEHYKEPKDFKYVVDEVYSEEEKWEKVQEQLEAHYAEMCGGGDGEIRAATKARQLKEKILMQEKSVTSKTRGKRSGKRKNGESFKPDDNEAEVSAVKEEVVAPASHEAYVCPSFFALNFSDVKKQVINGDFSFAPVLKEAVSKLGVKAVHAHVVASDAFSVFRDYMEVVQPEWAAFKDSIPDENGKPFFDKVGEYRIDSVKSATTPDRKKKAKPEGDASKERTAAVKALIKDLGCSDADWVTPENTRENILKSMKAHAKLATIDSPPATAEDWDHALAEGCKDFDTSPIESHAQQGFEGWYRLAATLADTSAGVSARFRRQSKKQWASDPELLSALLDLVQCRLILMLVHAEDVATYTPETVVKTGLKDVLLLSVKQEPHAPKKVKEGRFRMIWISSLVDCFVQKLLHKAVNARDIEHYQAGNRYHSAAGMGHHDEGVAQLCAAIDAVFGDDECLLTCDASMWDFTMDKQAHLNHAKRRCLSCTDPAVKDLIMTLAHLNYKHVCENKGDIWRCNKEGVNPSGQSSTTADNTFNRHSQAKASGAKKFIGNGDDMIADPGFSPELAARFGTKSRDVEVNSSKVVPFTSHHFDRASKTASYDRPVKLAWNLLSNCSSTDFGLRVDAMLCVIRNTPDALEKFKKHLGKYAQGSGTCNKELLWAI